MGSVYRILLAFRKQARDALYREEMSVSLFLPCLLVLKHMRTHPTGLDWECWPRYCADTLTRTNAELVEQFDKYFALFKHPNSALYGMNIETAVQVYTRSIQSPQP